MHYSFMKSSGFALLSLFLLCFQQAKAADFVVIDAGPAGTYGTIASAIAAASNGDRIIVTNKASLSPWVENLTVNKSLTFVSATDNVRFKLQGTITIQPANGREVTIIGLESINSTIVGATNVSSTRTVVNILGSSFTYVGVAIDFDANNYNLTVANCDLGLSGDIEFNYGKVLGNQARIIRKVSASINTIDKVQIIGNKCVAIYATDSDSYLEITNNFITGSRSVANSCLLVENLTTGNHTIANNTINMSGAYYGISMQSIASGASIATSSNVIIQSISTSNDYAFYQNNNTGSIITEYNYINSSNGLFGGSGMSLSATDQFISSVNIAADGRNFSGSPAIDGANPSIEYYDLNLTRGDAGAYGGSFTLDNYFPLTTGSSRVYHIIMDRGVFQGYNLDVKALGFDR